jgi:hypothetical protein
LTTKNGSNQPFTELDANASVPDNNILTNQSIIINCGEVFAKLQLCPEKQLAQISSSFWMEIPKYYLMKQNFVWNGKTKKDH